MTSMRSLFPGSRALDALADNAPLWPAGAQLSSADVSVLGLSLSTVGASITPVVVTGPISAPVRASSIIVVRVTQVANRWPQDPVHAAIDADLTSCLPVLDQIGVLGRSATTRRRPTQLQWPNGQRSETSLMPQDLHGGDLLAIPCHGNISTRQLRAHRIFLGPAHPEETLA